MAATPYPVSQTWSDVCRAPFPDALILHGPTPLSSDTSRPTGPLGRTGPQWHTVPPGPAVLHGTPGPPRTTGSPITPGPTATPLHRVTPGYPGTPEYRGPHKSARPGATLSRQTSTSEAGGAYRTQVLRPATPWAPCTWRCCSCPVSPVHWPWVSDPLRLWMSFWSRVHGEAAPWR